MNGSHAWRHSDLSLNWTIASPVVDIELRDGDRTLDEWMMIKTSVIDFVLLDLLALLEIVLRVLPSRNL